MAQDPYADSEAQFLAWIAGQGQQPAATDPYALGQAPAPTREEVPVCVLPAEPAPPPSQDQWWPSSWLAGGDQVAAAMNAPQTPAIGPEAAGAPPREPLAATPLELDRIPPPMFGPSPTPPPPEPRPDEPGLGTFAAGVAQNIALDSDPLRKDETGAYIDPDEASRDERLRSMPEAEYAVYKQRQADAAEATTRARALDEATLNAKRAQANFDAYQKANEHARQETERIQAESKALAKTRVSRDDYMKNRSTGSKILGVIQAVIGGLYQARTGSATNMGLQVLMKKADDYAEDMRADIAQRQQELQRQQGLVTTSLSKATDSYRVGELARQASYETVLRELDAQRQNFDPQGTAALRYADLYRGVKAAQAQALQAHAERTQKAAMEQWKTASEIEIKALRAAGGYGGHGGGGGSGAGVDGGIGTAADEKIVRPVEWLATRYRITDPDLMPPVPMSIKEYDDFLTKQGKQSTIAKTKQEMGAERRKLELERTLSGIVELDKDGKEVPFIPKGGDQTEVNKLLARKIATYKLVNIMDKAMSIRTGWSSDIGKSKEWQELKPLWSAAIIEAKNVGGLGVIAGPDMDIIEGWLGTDDPTRARGVVHAVAAARRQFEDSLRIELGGFGLSPQAAAKFKIPNLYAKKATDRPTDTRLRMVLEEGDTEADYEAVNPQSKEETEKYWADLRAAGWMTRSQKEILDGWAADLKKPRGPELDLAVDSLAEAAKSASSKGVREYAQNLLKVTNEAPIEGKWGGGTGLTYQP